LAHRGLWDLAPENSIPAIKEAIKRGAHGSEIDVCLTKTGEVVVLHDPVVNRVSNGEGWVKDLTLDQIKSFTLNPDPGKKHTKEKIPLLEELFIKFGKTAQLFIEMKRPGNMEDPKDGLEEKVGALIHKYDLYETTFVSSFNPISLARLKKARPRVRTVLEYHEGVKNGLPRPEVLKAAGDIYALGPKAETVTKEMADWAKAKGYKLSTFWVRTLDEMERIASLNFDLVTVDVPELYLMTLKGVFKPEGLLKLPPKYFLDFENLTPSQNPKNGKACLRIPIKNQGGALLQMSLKPGALCLITCYVKLNGEAPKDISKFPLLVVEREDKHSGEPLIKLADPKTPPDLTGYITRPLPLSFSPQIQDWIWIRFAFRSGFKTQSFLFVLGGAEYSGEILVDDFALRILDED